MPLMCILLVQVVYMLLTVKVKQFREKYKHPLRQPH